MKFKISIVICAFGILFASCKKETTMQEYMVGNWQTKYINLQMPTYQKSDSIHIIEDDFSNENSTLAQSVYKKDSTFTAWYLTPKGEKLSVTTGKWNVKNDSLYIEFTMNNITTKAKYLVEKTEDGFQGKSLDDWDKDGEIDDFLLMKTKRLNPEE